MSARLRALPGSPTLAVTAKANAMKAAGVDVVSFAAGEPDFDTPAHVCDAAAAAARAGDTRYTPAVGTVALRDAVARYHVRHGGVQYERDEIVVSCGAKHVLYGLLQALVDPGDGVVVPTPYWVSYPPQIQLAGGLPVTAQTRAEDDLLLTPAGLDEAMERGRADGARMRVLVLNTPSNPTGAAYGRKQLEAVVEAALGHGLTILADEIYHRLTYDGFEQASVAALGPDAQANTFTVNGVSKTWAMTGWRIGWACGDAGVLAAVGRLQSQSTSNPTSVAQAAALAALDGPDGFLAEWLAAYDARRRAFVAGVDAIDGITCALPKGAFYAFPSVQGLLGRRRPDGGVLDTDTDVALWLLDEARVAVVPGTPFGAPGHVRVSYATSIERVREGVSRIAAAVATLGE